jgi:hypothetical protein
MATRKLVGIGIVTLLASMGLVGSAAAQDNRLSIGFSKGLAPSVFSKSGIGTANAVVEAKVTRKDAEEWCGNWEPQKNLETCIKKNLEAEAGKTYRATADCRAGRITSTDAKTYTFAGVWDASDIGAGRTKWRDASGQIVGRDNASAGLGISANWEALCPGPLRITPTGRTATDGGGVPADSGWTLVSASDWLARAPALAGRRVEVSGNLSTQLMVNPHSNFSNTGWMRDAGNKELATVMFDQIGDAEVAWMRKNRCSNTCEGVFVRGEVVSGRGSRAPILRMIDVSFESRAGGVAASMVQLEPPPANTSAVHKQLLPPGGVPTALGASAVTQMPETTPDSTAGKSMSQKMEDRSRSIRQRNMNIEKGQIPGPERPANFETSYRSIRDTQLSNVFVNYPWNVGRNSWPRVALVVEEKPTGGTGALGSLQPGDKIKDRCWRLGARLWTGPAASQDIAPFNWCLSEMRFNVSYNAVALWGMTPATSMAEHNTGPARTQGPNPPMIPAPRFHYSDGSFSDTIMLGNLLLDMSFSFGVPDGRVWIVDGPKESSTGAASDNATRAGISSNPTFPF